MSYKPFNMLLRNVKQGDSKLFVTAFSCLKSKKRLVFFSTNLKAFLKFSSFQYLSLGHISLRFCTVNRNHWIADGKILKSVTEH